MILLTVAISVRDKRQRMFIVWIPFTPQRENKVQCVYCKAQLGLHKIMSMVNKISCSFIAAYHHLFDQIVIHPQLVKDKCENGYPKWTKIIPALHTHSLYCFL